MISKFFQGKCLSACSLVLFAFYSTNNTKTFSFLFSLLFLLFYWQDLNHMDKHNQAHQFELVLEKK